jgi:polyisoprenyl-teichoic acid--peptidoglycan teichoic acid transferase
VNRSVRLLALLATVVLVLAGGAYVGWRVVVNRANHAIPQTDLFGDNTPGASGQGSPTSTAPPPGADIKGPLNILIAGVDTRVSVPGWVPHSDAIMIMHVDASLTHAYLTSLPRDLVVNIPAFAPSHFGGAHSKITHAMTFGSRVSGQSNPNPALGFQLLAKTVSAYTGIPRFDAGAVLTFNGLIGVVEMIGGIDVYVDQQVVSIHLRPDGRRRTPCASCAHGYTGPQMTYTVGLHHFFGWQALDYSRQRYLSGGDYTRQRHQRQVIKAIVAKLFSSSVVSNPARIGGIIHALGNAIIFDGRGRTPLEFAYALRNLNSSAITLVGLPGFALYSGGSYLGESLFSIQASYFAALRADTLDTFVKAHPELVNADPR